MFKSKLISPRVLLVLICLLFLFTRLYKISEIPPSAYWDEASIGYNAYSVLTTGKDEWGEFLPIHFRAFGEFKLPVYIYSVIPFVQIFGLNEFSVRIPAVLFSLGSIILIYLLAKKISSSEVVGLFSALLMTISPWFFIFSRTGFEVTAGIMFYLLGIYLFLHKLNGKLFFLAVLSLTLSAYSYNGFRIISPVTLLILLLIEREYIIKLLQRSVSWVILSCIILFLVAWPIWRLYVYDAGGARLQTAGEVSTAMIIRNYLAHFDPYFLFLQGDKNLRHQQSGFGQLFLPELPLMIMGLIYVFRNNSRYKMLLPILILLSPIPAAITKESPHALRSLSMVPFLHIISAWGVFYLIHLIKKSRMIYIAISGVFLIFFVNFFYSFLSSYPQISAEYWQLSYKKIFMDPKLQFEKQDKIYISDRLGQPYIFALFYLKYDPEKFRMEVVRNSIDKWGFSTVKSFGKFEFGDYR